MDINVLKSELTTLQVKSSTFVDGLKGRNLSDAEATSLQADANRILELKGMIAFLEKHPSGDPRQPGVGDSGVSNNDGFGKFAEPKAGGATKSYLTPEAFKRTIRAEVESGAKALVAGGSVATATSFDGTPVPLARPVADLSLFNVLPVTVRETEDYTFTKQTVRNDQAAVVAVGTQKPTSVYTFGNVPNKLVRVAHVSQFIDSYLLADSQAAESFLVNEMTNGVWKKVNSLGVTTFAGTAGITTQAFQGNAMDSIYLGSSKAIDLGFSPDVVLISRADFDTLMLAKDSAGNYLYRNPNDSRINGLAPIISAGLPAKSAIVLDTSKIGLSVDRAGTLTKWDAITRLDYNEARVLVEARVAFDVVAPESIVKVGTAV